MNGSFPEGLDNPHRNRDSFTYMVDDEFDMSRGTTVHTIFVDTGTCWVGAQNGADEIGSLPMSLDDFGPFSDAASDEPLLVNPETACDSTAIAPETGPQQSPAGDALPNIPENPSASAPPAKAPSGTTPTGGNNPQPLSDDSSLPESPATPNRLKRRHSCPACRKRRRRARERAELKAAALPQIAPTPEPPPDSPLAVEVPHDEPHIARPSIPPSADVKPQADDSIAEGNPDI